MSSTGKNTLVGVVVLGGLALLGWMILRFADAPVRWFSAAPNQIVLVSDRADGLYVGSPMLYRGVTVGSVLAIRHDPQRPQVVLLDAMLMKGVVVPADVEGQIRLQQYIGGTSAIHLEDLPSASAARTLQGGETLTCRYVGLGLVPDELSEVARQLSGMIAQVRKDNLSGEITALAVDLRQTSQHLRESRVFEQFASAAESLRAQLEKAGALIDSLQALAGDKQLVEDIRATAAALRQGSEKLGALMDEGRAAVSDARGGIGAVQKGVDDFTRQATDRLTQLARLMEGVQSVVAKIDEGKGTAGQLVNDPRLYQALVETTRSLELTVKDLQRLIRQWEQEGLRLKL